MPVTGLQRETVKHGQRKATHPSRLAISIRFDSRTYYRIAGEVEELQFWTGFADISDLSER